MATRACRDDAAQAGTVMSLALAERSRAATGTGAACRSVTFRIVVVIVAGSCGGDFGETFALRRHLSDAPGPRDQADRSMLRVDYQQLRPARLQGKPVPLEDWLRKNGLPKRPIPLFNPDDYGSSGPNWQTPVVVVIW
ncbi:hypothetical protein [Paracoccus aestuariivivens]|uniref:hypothetical protein n=1 Tax=Paracoccus aestuariivivens TaxID=1820333 RepID=UPI0014792F7F|nr:hypothetical protein [Paracoccus aestuariivivens]